ncbi:two-component system sensor histidine kinase NtrB [Haloplanus salinarum]|uniref:two-component system sensor histidine kinase NtrB n=1 Tax=Haloplanus salinarum TaxID=1912324 RepID=UPI00214ACB68|nr:PAS domain-containing sensor histidine kinase [Haloplanus salinarum]
MDATSDVSTGTGHDEGAYRRLLEGTAAHATFMLDADGDVSMWPAVARSLYGHDPDAMVGRGLERLFADDRGTPPPLDDLLAEAATAPIEIEGWHVRDDGSVFWATCTVSPLGTDGTDGYAVVSHDTTASKQRERMLERQNDRLKEFTDILSHDLRTPLSVVDGRLELFRETGDPEHLAAIEATTDRMEDLVDDLLRVARQGDVVERPETTDIGRVLDIAKEGALSGDATCTYDPVPAVMADPDRLVQLFENLLRNSVEHGSTSSRRESADDTVEHGSTGNRTESGDSEGSEIPREAGKAGAPPVHVAVGPLENGFYVEDDGSGIPTADRDRVFEHGYTTHEDGTGYGLSVVRSIVGAHGWDITVTDAAGGGARFEITAVDFTGEP